MCSISSRSSASRTAPRPRSSTPTALRGSHVYPRRPAPATALLLDPDASGGGERLDLGEMREQLLPERIPLLFHLLDGPEAGLGALEDRRLARQREHREDEPAARRQQVRRALEHLQDP